MTTPQQDPLARALAQEAEQFHGRGGSDLEIGQVLARAGEIRRGRRMRASLLMAACVLAVLAPIGIVSLDHDPSRREPTPAGRVEDRSPLTLEGLRVGKEPARGWFQGKVWHGPEGRESPWSGGRVVAVAPVGDALLVASTGPEGQRAYLQPPAGDQAQTLTSWPMEGGFAVSSDGKVAAFAKPDGSAVIVQDSGAAADATARIPRGTGFDAVAITGESCNEVAAGGDCTAWVNSRGQKPEAWTSSSRGTAEPVSGSLVQVADVVAGRLVAGITSVTDTGSCSAVDDADGAAIWTTCKHRFLSFSPDGKRLLASAAYADGMGDTRLAVLDAATGKAGLDLQVADGGAITQMVWEDDTHVLAVVYQGNRWGVVRVGLDGQRELAVAPVRDSGDLASPFVLATR